VYEYLFASFGGLGSVITIHRIKKLKINRVHQVSFCEGPTVIFALTTMVFDDFK
jgi:hypothetical protein